MYGKIFEQIYNSTVCQDWKTLVVFQQCIILSDELGILDMTPEAISRRTNIPLDIILHGLKELEKPDERSRSSKADGRRLERIDSHRDWGWVVVNKVEYRKLASRLEKQQNDRLRISEKRKKDKEIKDVAICRKQSRRVVNVAHTDTDTDTNTDTKTYTDLEKKELPNGNGRKTSEPYLLIQAYKTEFQTLYGKEYLESNKDFGIAKRIILKVGFEQAKELLKKYFTIKDVWLDDHAYSLEEFIRNFNKIRVHGESKKKSGNMTQQEAIKRRDEIDAQLKALREKNKNESRQA